MGAFVADRVLTVEDRLQGGEVLVHQPTPHAERDLHDLEVVLPPTDGRRDGQAAAGQLMDGRDLLREQPRVAERQLDPAHSESDRPDSASEEGDGRQALEEVRWLSHTGFVRPSTRLGDP